MTALTAVEIGVGWALALTIFVALVVWLSCRVVDDPGAVLLGPASSDEDERLLALSQLDWAYERMDSFVPPHELRRRGLA